MTKTLYIMCGPAGAGKSTWIKNHANPRTSTVISRDKIRFNLVKEDEYYFAKENRVYFEFTTAISTALWDESSVEVYADATHLNEKSRMQLLKALDIPSNTRIVPVVIKPDIDTAIKQNAQRTGRERVPDSVIENMYNSFTHPKYDRVKYDEIIEVN